MTILTRKTDRPRPCPRRIADELRALFEQRRRPLRPRHLHEWLV
jgi:hypothetical protein